MARPWVRDRTQRQADEGQLPQQSREGMGRAEPSCSSSNMAGTLLPQGLCTHCVLSLECPSPVIVLTSLCGLPSRAAPAERSEAATTARRVPYLFPRALAETYFLLVLLSVSPAKT